MFRPYERSTGKDTEPGGKAAGTRISALTPKPKEPSQEGPRAPEAVQSPASASEKVVIARTPQRKATPTRTRRQAEAERMERLHPSLTPKEQRKADRAARADARLQAFDKQESSPERRLLRDFVDSRWTINEFMLPAMILIMAGVMFTTNNLVLSSTIAMGLWLLMAMAVVNTFFMWRSFKKVLDERLPGTDKRGLLMYMFNRALMMRRFRRPAPTVERGGFE
nr:DUF3043 domain-containing protein [Tessaracoccus sp. OS52]